MKGLINKPVIVSVLVVGVFLVLTSVVWAGWSSTTRLQVRMETNHICKDGIVFGLADSDAHTYRVDFFRPPPPQNPPPTGVPVARKAGISLSGVNPPEPYCKPIPTNTNGFETNFCSGIVLPWSLNKDTKLNMYVFNESGPIENAQPINQVLTVANCSIDPEVQVTQTRPGSTSAIVTNALVFQVKAFDSILVGTTDGAGISTVDMRVINSSGTTVRQKTESNAGYCVFGGDKPCTTWNFSSNNYEWPNNQLIENGTHTLRATAKTADGRSKTINKTIQIQLPLVTNFLQTGPGSTSSSVSDALVFQIEAYVGPRYSDGKYIDNVDMRIISPDGQEVYQRTESAAGYCAFSGGSPACNQWNFADEDYKWPSGQPIQQGTHILRATVNTTDGRSETVEKTIQIQSLPITTKLVQTAPSTTTTVISETMVFQVEAQVGPHNGDGTDIAKVDLSILDSNQVVVHQSTDDQAKYCAFGGGAPICNQWVFANQNYKWPSGQAIQNGTHTLRATVNTTDGRSKSIDNTIQIQINSNPGPPTPLLIFVYLPMVVK